MNVPCTLTFRETMIKLVQCWNHNWRSLFHQWSMMNPRSNCISLLCSKCQFFLFKVLLDETIK